MPRDMEAIWPKPCMKLRKQPNKSFFTQKLVRHCLKWGTASMEEPPLVYPHQSDRHFSLGRKQAWALYQSCTFQVICCVDVTLLGAIAPWFEKYKHFSTLRFIIRALQFWLSHQNHFWRAKSHIRSIVERGGRRTADCQLMEAECRQVSRSFAVRRIRISFVRWHVSRWTALFFDRLYAAMGTCLPAWFDRSFSTNRSSRLERRSFVKLNS